MENLAKALVALQAEITNPPMLAKNPFFKSKYTDLKTAIDHYRPVLANHGFAIVQAFNVTDAEKPTLETCLLHESGESIRSNLILDMPSDPQKAGAYITYMRRYALNAIMNCAGDPDDDGNSVSGKNKKEAPPPPPPPKDDKMITPAQVKKFKAMITNWALSQEDAKAYLKTESIKDLKAVTIDWIFENEESFKGKLIEYIKGKDV